MNSVSQGEEKSAVRVDPLVSANNYPITLLIIPAIVILGQLIYMLLQWQDFVNYDCAYYFLCAKKILDGKQPFVDFVDLLPPLIFYLSVPPVWLSQLLKVPIATVWSITVWCTIVLSFLASLLLVRSARDISGRDWLAIAPLMCGFLLFNLILGFHFGQREHIFVLTFFPIYLMRWLRWTSPSAQIGTVSKDVNKWLAIVCGSACAVAIFVKPQFLILPVLLELYFSQTPMHQKRWHVLKAPEILSLAATLLFCLGISSFIPNVQTYYSRWVPFISEGYGAFYASNPFFMLLFAAPDGQMLGNTTLAAFVCFLVLCFSSRSVLLGSLLVWVVAGLLLYLIQGRGWSYQSIPAICGYFLMTNVIIAKAAELLISRFVQLRPGLRFLSPRLWSVDPSISSETRSKVATIVFLTYALLLMPVSTLLVHNSSATATTFKTLDGIIASQTEPRDKVVILHTLTPNAHQAQLRLDREPACRYIWCFPLRMTTYLKKSNRTHEKALKEEPRIVSEIIEDIRKSKPKLIAIEACPVDWSGWTLYKTLMDYAFIRRALNNYEPIGGCNKFAIWKIRSNTEIENTNIQRENNQSNDTSNSRMQKP